MIIRKADIDDKPALLELEQGVVEAERPFNPSIKKDKTYYYDIDFLLSDENSYLIVAEESGEIVATGYLQIRDSKAALRHEKHGYLGFMFVSPQYRGQGINKCVLEHLLKWGKERKISDFYLDVYSQNLAAINAYKKAGFSPCLTEMKLSL